MAHRSELAHDLQRGERGFRSLDWEEVRYLDRHGVTIASHTRTHHDCGTGGYAELVAEIAGSRRDLETSSASHRCVRVPQGQTAQRVARRVSTRLAALLQSSCRPRPERTPGHSPPGELRRYCHPDTIWELELQLQALLDRAAPPLPVPQDAEPSPRTPAVGD